MYQPTWGCRAGFSGLMNDAPGKMWASKTQGVGAWISLRLVQKYKFTKFEYINRNNEKERNSKLEVSFDEGIDSQEYSLEDTYTTSTFTLTTPVVSQRIKFTIKTVYGTINNGGGFNVYGE